MESYLTIEISDTIEELNCDGCGKIIRKGDKMLTNIDSCCGGGCVRSICIDCLEYAYKQLAEHKVF